jgi:hypothetical protein
MKRMCQALAVAFVAALAVGCGSGSPTQPAGGKVDPGKVEGGGKGGPGVAPPVPPPPPLPGKG